ncbi:hypothetical protein [Endozoicomonas arenosclerae]|uniref:hypothetical protein n=1 Tax=Endozoicomonas arenosclerae TaxID=1633495 RepID=UPI000786742F|nr:hypothetical protein [Endozoicomonas arenosclerae]
MYIRILVSTLALTLMSWVCAREVDDILASDSRVIHYDGMLISMDFPIQKYGNQTETLEVSWWGDKVLGPPLTLCSTAPLFEDDAGSRNVSLSQEYTGQYFLNRLTPSGHGAHIQLANQGVLLNNCSQIAVARSGSLWSVAIEFKPVIEVALHYSELAYRLSSQLHNKTGVLSDPSITEGRGGAGSATVEGGYAGVPWDLPQKPKRRGKGLVNPALDIEVTPIFLSTLLHQEDESDEEVEPPLWLEVLISNDEESFSTTLTGSEWTRLISSYGISRAGIMAFLRDRDCLREEWTEMEKVLDRILARQDDGVAFEEDDRVVRSLLDELMTPQSVEFRVPGALPPGVLFYGKKKKGKGGSAGQGGSKGQGGRKKNPRGNPGASPDDGVQEEGAAGGQQPSDKDTGQSSLTEGADLNVAAIIVRSRLSDLMSQDSILLGLYGAGIMDWKQFNRLSQMRDRSDCSHQVMDIARSLVELGEKLDFLRVVYQGVKSVPGNKPPELLRRVPAKYQPAVETVPHVVLVEPDNAEEMAALMSRVAAMSFLESRNLADFRRHLQDKWPDLFPASGDTLSGRDMLAVCLESHACGFRQLYVEKKLIETVSDYISPELKAFVEANGLDDLKDRHPPVQLYNHSIGMSNGFSLIMKSPIKVFTKDQAQRLESAVKQAVAKSSGRRMTIPGALISEMDLSNIQFVQSDTLGRLIQPPPGMEAFRPVYHAVIQSGTVDVAYNLTQAIINGEPLTLDPGISSETYLVAMVDYVQTLEERGLIDSEQASIVKDYLHNLNDLFHGVVPDRLNPIPLVAGMLGVVIMDGEDGRLLFGTSDREVKHTVTFLRLSSFFLHVRIGVFQIFTRQFARELHQCLMPLSRPMIEIAAGRGQLSSALQNEGYTVARTTDIREPDQPWKGVQVEVASAREVVKTHKNNVVYLSSQTNIVMLKSLITSGEKIVVLQTGKTFSKELKSFVANNRLRVLELNIPGYVPVMQDDRVRLLMINMSQHEYDEIASLIPQRYKMLLPVIVPAPDRTANM